jgi:hypothetical protein
MNRPPDLDTRLAAWFEEGPTSGPDGLLPSAFARARSTRQDRVWLPRLTHPTRTRSMNNLLKVAAVAILAFAVGIGVGPHLTSPNGVGSAPASPSPSPVALPAGGTLDQGRYYVDPGTDIAPARFSFTVPAGWVRFDGGIASNGVPLYPAAGWEGEVGLDSWLVTHVYSDACHHTTLVDAGTTVDELTTALQAQEHPRPVTDTTVAGYPAKHIELTIPSDLDIATCENGVIRFWPGPGPDLSSGMCCSFGPGSTVALDIVDVDGHRWVVVARRGPNASADQLAALDGVLESIRIETPASPSPSPATPSASPAAPFSPMPDVSGPGYQVMAPGRHVMSEPNTDGVGTWPAEVIVTVPAGWVQASRQRGGGIWEGIADRGPLSAQGGLEFGRLGSVGTGPGACPSPEPTGPTIGDLVTRLQAVADAWPAGTGPGLEVSDLAIGGYAGKRVEFTIPEGGPACQGLFGWTTPEGGEQWGPAWGQGQHRQLSILDIDGARFVIDAWYSADAAPEVRARVQAVVDSVEFE